MIFQYRVTALKFTPIVAGGYIVAVTLTPDSGNAFPEVSLPRSGVLADAFPGDIVTLGDTWALVPA